MHSSKDQVSSCDPVAAGWNWMSAAQVWDDDGTGRPAEFLGSSEVCLNLLPGEAACTTLTLKLRPDNTKASRCDSASDQGTALRGKPLANWVNIFSASQTVLFTFQSVSKCLTTSKCAEVTSCDISTPRGHGREGGLGAWPQAQRPVTGTVQLFYEWVPTHETATEGPPRLQKRGSYEVQNLDHMMEASAGQGQVRCEAGRAHVATVFGSPSRSCVPRGCGK